MKAHFTFEVESNEDFAALAHLFNFMSGSTRTAPPQHKSTVVHADAPAPQAVVEAPAQPEQTLSEPVGETPKPEEPEAAGGEVVDKAMVSKELRAFIAKRGEAGPKAAFAVLKEFGAAKFDQLKPEDYSKFLSALSKAA